MNIDNGHNNVKPSGKHVGLLVDQLTIYNMNLMQSALISESITKWKGLQI